VQDTGEQRAITASRSLCYTSRLKHRVVGGVERSMKRTWQPKRIPRKRTHGFMARMATRGGRKVIKARRLKGRHKLTV